MASRQAKNRARRRALLKLFKSTELSPNDNLWNNTNKSTENSQTTEFFPMDNMSLIEIFTQDNKTSPHKDTENDDGLLFEEFASENAEETSESSRFTLIDDLLLFMITFNISKCAMESLLQTLNRHDIKVPKSVYLLKKNCNRHSFSIFDISKGNFAYSDILSNITFLLQNKFLYFKEKYNNIVVHINIDGLPLFKSSTLGLWPILMTIKNCTYPKPLPIGVFCGFGKPPLQEFISNLVTDLKTLTSSYTLCCNYHIKITNVVFIADAPARAFLQGIVGHNGKFGCGYCKIEGQYIDNRMCYLYSNCIDITSVARTDNEYLLNRGNNQLSFSPLACVSSLRYSFPPEFMHSVCLGVVRKILTFFFSYVKGSRLPCRLSVQQKDEINILIQSLTKYVPREFNRKIRSLKEFEHFKAVEFRSFILYFGPILLKNFLPANFYSNFLLLHFAMYCFASDLYHKKYFANASACIELFCRDAEVLYQNKLMTYNTHVLRHIPEFVNLYGPLDSWSAFIYENYLGILKRRLKCTRGMFSQTLNTLNSVKQLFALKKERVLFFSTKPPDNCAILEDGSIVLISEITVSNGVNFVSENILHFKEPLYVIPYSSEFLKIGYYEKSFLRVHNKNVFSKCICFSLNDKLLIIPLVQSDVFVE